LTIPFVALYQARREDVTAPAAARVATPRAMSPTSKEQTMGILTIVLAAVLVLAGGGSAWAQPAPGATVEERAISGAKAYCRSTTVKSHARWIIGVENARCRARSSGAATPCDGAEGDRGDSDPGSQRGAMSLRAMRHWCRRGLFQQFVDRGRFRDGDGWGHALDMRAVELLPVLSENSSHAQAARW
jgi:hypothetical protein